MNYESFKLENIPSTCFYIANFITEAEETLLLHNINKISPVRWTQLMNRRLLNLGGVPTQKGMIAEEIPSFLQDCLDRINGLGMFGDAKANHILLNEYKPGQVRLTREKSDDNLLIFFIYSTGNYVAF